MTLTNPAELEFDLQGFTADTAERVVPDVATALAMQRERRPELAGIIRDLSQSYLEKFGDQHSARLRKTQDALCLSFARLAVRHGSWGEDFHHYHNEDHAMELLNGRLALVRVQLGWGAFDPMEWLLLSLFCTCHDLRQREAPSFDRDVGANERASIAETYRILDLSGFDRKADQEFYQTLQAMIAGSTFDARPEPPDAPLNSAEAVSSGGSLSAALVRKMEAQDVHWRSKPDHARRHRLMLVASDLDTANVGEPFRALAASAVRLICEREMRAGRSLDTLSNAHGVLDFLTHGQQQYFFKLHRFVSEIGQRVFGEGKASNGPKLMALTAQMQAEFADSSALPRTMIARFEAIADGL
jgi:hypothetical protein